VSAVTLNPLDAFVVAMESKEETSYVTLGDVFHYYQETGPASLVYVTDRYNVRIELKGPLPKGFQQVVGRQIDGFGLCFPGGSVTFFSSDFSADGECALRMWFRDGSEIEARTSSIRCIASGPLSRHKAAPEPGPHR
jgi:hypothetical protein